MGKLITFIKSHNRLFLLLLVAIVVVVFVAYRNIGSKQPISQITTAAVERGIIFVSLSVSGQVSTANSAQVTTEASGVVKKIFVTNGQQVTAGQALAEIELDMEGRQRNAQALASYQSAQNNLFSLQSSMLTAWQKYMDTAQSTTYQNGDASPNTGNRLLTPFVITQDNWLATEAQYKNQQNSITQAYLAYQQNSPLIYAPISGKITGLGLQTGSVITAQSNSSGGSSAQKIASIITQATPTITVNLTEIDVPKVKIGNKVTVTLDAFSGKTYAGEVISIDTVGAVSSGVTTYPAVIRLETDSQNILTNMSAQAKIITDVKNNVLLIPTSAISNNTVRVIKNGKQQTVPVETGLTSGTHTEIISGLSEGDVVVTSFVIPTTSSSRSNQTPSVFGSFGGGGNARFIGR
ncbi:efflux RND transporter periplasmic adaptor subunit [Candidatus Microgenomates bacterium]|nr:efflux RND transporter periplasmic adaptor subunit [Candidatus Microgenomates bacterium]